MQKLNRCSPPMIIGKCKITDANTGQPRTCRYSDIGTIINGWVDAKAHLPIAFDLLHLRLESAPRPKSGWWTGFAWDGLRLAASDKVTHWKRQDHD